MLLPTSFHQNCQAAVLDCYMSIDKFNSFFRDFEIPCSSNQGCLLDDKYPSSLESSLGKVMSGSIILFEITLKESDNASNI